MTAESVETRGGAERPGVRGRLRGWAALFGLGMVGVLALAITVAPSLRGTPGLDGLSSPALVALAAANATLLLAVFVALGAATAPRVGLRSHVYQWATGRQSDWSSFLNTVPLATGLGVAAFVAAAALEAAFAPFVTLETGAVLSDSETLRALAASVPMRLLYGGITEELLLRWGVMAPLAWLLWRARARFGTPSERPSAAVMWLAVLGAAILFGVGHLPALLATYDATAALVARTVVLNAVVGIAFGWVFWRRSLEAAMVAHASFHVALLAVSTVLVVAL